MSTGSFELHYGSQIYAVSSPQLTGRQIRELLGLNDESFDLIVEGLGHDPDLVVSDFDVISLRESPRRVFARPPTNFGAGWL